MALLNGFYPLSAGGDAASWPYLNRYFAQHLQLWPWPHLTLLSNDSFYPAGTVQVFQPWCLEREYLVMFLTKCFGSGPWLKLYFFLSLTLTASGCFLMLKRPYGAAKAALAGFLLSVGHVYLLSKFPQHLNLAVAHWTLLSLVCDFLILKAALEERRLALRWFCLRLLLTLLSLGLDLTYVAGYSLSSLCLTTGALLWFKGKGRWTLERHLDLASKGALLLAFILSWLYLPLLWEISLQARQFDFSQVPPSNYWALPLRLGLSYLLPDRWSQILMRAFGDNVENAFVLRPGLFLPLLALFAWPQVRQRWRAFLPLWLLSLLCLCYHPVLLPSLKLFPWFVFHRVGGRSSLIYPVVLVLMALQLPLPNLPEQRTQRLLLAGILALGSIELDLAYAALPGRTQDRPLSPDFRHYLQKIANLPGEALLEWPFCATGGNGVGLSELCPYFERTASLYSWRRLHHKKVMGQYFGRLHPSQLQAYLNSGWDRLLVPVSKLREPKQERCFSPQEWRFFDAYYRHYDFAALSLVTQTLPQACVQQFIQRYGPPQARAEAPKAGLVLLFVRPQSWPQGQNVPLPPTPQTTKALETAPRFRPWLPIRPVNLLQEIQPEGLKIQGLGPLAKTRRVALGSETQLSFALAHPGSWQLQFKVQNQLPEQTLELWLDQKQLRHFSLHSGQEQALKMQVSLSAGPHQLRFRYGRHYDLKTILQQYWHSNPPPQWLNLPKLKKTYRALKNQALWFSQLKWEPRPSVPRKSEL